MSPRPDDSQAIRVASSSGGPSVRLSTGVALLGAAAVLGGFGTFLVSTGARGGEAAADVRAVKATADRVPALETKVAVHDSQISELHGRLKSIDDRLEKILGRLPPPGPK